MTFNRNATLSPGAPSAKDPTMSTHSPAGSRRARLSDLLSTFGAGTTERIVLAALVALILLTGVVRPAALGMGNLQNILIAAVPLIILSVGQLLDRDIDRSREVRFRKLRLELHRFEAGDVSLPKVEFARVEIRVEL